MRPIIHLFGVLLITISIISNVQAQESSGIDASDPTKIYTYAGLGFKYTDYTNNESMTEIRATGNIGLSASDMIMFEIGYGWSTDDTTEGSDSDITNGRLRWFHLFPMNDSVVSGYRGWGTQIDLQLAGSLKGTDGQNVLALGPLPAFGISENWSFYLPMNIVSSWNKNFEEHNGIGLGVAPLLVYTPPNWWEGAYVQIWPNYTYFVSGELDDTGSGSLDLTLGGNITQTLLWAATFQKNVDEDLNSYRRGRDTELTNDWNAYLNVTMYF